MTAPKPRGTATHAPLLSFRNQPTAAPCNRQRPEPAPRPSRRRRKPIQASHADERHGIIGQSLSNQYVTTPGRSPSPKIQTFK